MSIVAGIDVGTFHTKSYVAWLRDREFTFGSYRLSPERPLPERPSAAEGPSHIGVDAPQGLPKQGFTVRRADREANTPTKRLPTTWSELSRWPVYRGLIEAGITLFWRLYEDGKADIPGLPGAKGPVATVFETYPRYVLRRLWQGRRPIPSKRKTPAEYIAAVTRLLSRAGYTIPLRHVTETHHVDAMLCAVAAEAFSRSKGLPGGTVGERPLADPVERVLREGYIVSP
ncbi:MAG: DUF429 domain-containing protein [Methanobacteriota archaeon]|nr:MAG: DUF429 domain-containing protein [Euryarchaeota archaeon]